jgi:type IV pilus assembly protein PilY1
VLQTSISASDAFAAIFSGASVLWEDPITVLSARVDDFLHAAVNSRGEFLNVKDWEDLVAALGRTVLNSPGSAGSSASVVLNSGALRDETRLYQARFISDTWGGELLAYEINADGSVGRLIWEAGDVLTASGASGRKIYTYDRTTKKGIEFFAANDGAFNALPKAIRDAVGTREVLDYLRGDRSKEVANGGTYRNRKTLLGDLISSAPAFVGVPTAPYPDEWCTEIDNNGNCNSVPEDGVPYSTSFRFAPANLTRPQVIYVGSNDGMLHAFEVGTWNASAQKWVDGTGMELFAYIPSSAFSTTGKPNIGSLASTSYVHTYFADGSPTVVDAFVNGEWRTVLVAGLGGGGRGIYALDVTDPTAPKVMWEFTDANDADLGYTFSRPNIVRLNNDKWAVVFGNGYNSGSDKAYLYVRDIVDGSSIAKIAAGSATGNGLSTVSPVDEDGDFTADLVYAGDLKGNLWKFTLRGKNTGKWVVSGPNGSTTTPIFSATSPSTGTPAQPITSRPQVIAHPYGGGFIVLFGTGKFLESSDLDTPQATQSYYGIWDTYDNDDSKKDGNQYNHGAQKVTRSDLLTQEILAEPTANGYVYRLTTNSVPKWKAVGAAGTGTHLGWHLDLVLKGAASNFGERQVSDSVVRSGRTIFTTLIPPVAQSGASDPCKFGGEGWLMELNAVTGARMEFSPFDVNGDGVFNLGWEAGKPTGDAFDLSGKPVAASGRKSAVGIIPTPAILARPDGGKEYKYVAGSKGSIDMIVESAGASDFGRQSWRQLFK